MANTHNTDTNNIAPSSDDAIADSNPQSQWNKTNNKTHSPQIISFFRNNKWLSWGLIVVVLITVAVLSWQLLPATNLNFKLPWDRTYSVSLEVGGSRTNSDNQSKKKQSKGFLSNLLNPDREPPSSPSPRPIKPIGKGKQEFKFSHGSQVKVPKIQTAIIDPIDPSPNQTQTITIDIKHDSALTYAAVTIETDNQTLTQNLKLIKGDTQNGTWQTQLQLKDSYDYNYYIKFDLRSPTGDYNSGLRLRM